MTPAAPRRFWLPLIAAVVLVACSSSATGNASPEEPSAPPASDPLKPENSNPPSALDSDNLVGQVWRLREIRGFPVSHLHPGDVVADVPSAQIWDPSLIQIWEDSDVHFEQDGVRGVRLGWDPLDPGCASCVGFRFVVDEETSELVWVFGARLTPNRGNALVQSPVLLEAGQLVVQEEWAPNTPQRTRVPSESGRNVFTCSLCDDLAAFMGLAQTYEVSWDASSGDLVDVNLSIVIPETADITLDGRELTIVRGDMQVTAEAIR